MTNSARTAPVFVRGAVLFVLARAACLCSKTRNTVVSVETSAPQNKAVLTADVFAFPAWSLANPVVSIPLRTHIVVGHVIVPVRWDKLARTASVFVLTEANFVMVNAVNLARMIIAMGAMTDARMGCAASKRNVSAEDQDILPTPPSQTRVMMMRSKIKKKIQGAKLFAMASALIPSQIERIVEVVVSNALEGLYA
jgi:hypothetical protein